ncbi:MAG TPA: hypothetical protein VJB13_04150 [Candidatus Nanoarchaeia archaeon]|nr:hypothetical protein [Candidatus Nanoarchaeia archaeon]
MPEIFPESRNLKAVLEAYDWTLYSLPVPQIGAEPLTWTEINDLVPRKEYEIGQKYILLPQPDKKKPLSEAYAESRRSYIIPAFRVPQVGKEFDFAASEKFSFGGYDFYFLSHVQFEPERVITFGDPLLYPPHSSVIHLPRERTLDAFTCYFGTVKIENNGFPTFLRRKVVLN